MRLDALNIDVSLPLEVLEAAHTGYVTLDGKKQTEIRALDTTEGWVEKLRRDEQGQYYIENEEVVADRLYGKVELFNKDAVKVA